MSMSLVRYYLFWPIYISLWLGRFSSTTRSSDEGKFRKKTIVEHELDHKRWEEKHFWAPVYGLGAYSIAWVFFLLFPALGLIELSLITSLSLLMSYFYFLFILSPTNLFLILIYSLIFPNNGDPMETFFMIYLPAIEFGFFGLSVDFIK